MKPWFVRIGLIALALSALLLWQAESSRLMASILGAGSSVRTTSVPMERDDVMEGYNVYHRFHSEEDLLLELNDQVMTRSRDFLRENLSSILSFAERIDRYAEDANAFFPVFPFWPEDNPATYGNVLLYLFPKEVNPLQMAQDEGWVGQSVNPGTFLSRERFLSLLQKALWPTKEGAFDELLAETGVIERSQIWRDRDPGFPLIEAVQVINRIVQLKEARMAGQATQKFQDNLVSLPTKAQLKVSKQTLEVLYKAFEHEASKRLPQVDSSFISFNAFRDKASSFLSYELSLPIVLKIREAYYDLLSRRSPALYRIPDQLYLGECNSQLPKKFFMGSLSVTGDKGAHIRCDGVTVMLPPNALVVNGWSLPEVLQLNNRAYPEQDLARLKSLYSYQNTLVLTAQGESTIGVQVYHPDALRMVRQNRSFAVHITDDQKRPFFSKAKPYVSEGAYLKMTPRAFDRVHFISFFEDFVE